MLKKYKKIGQILLENNFIDQRVLDEALEYQTKFGGNITQFLVMRGYITEADLAKCISTQFDCPYLPLGSYEIPYDIINLIPLRIAEKYWLVPVDKLSNILTLVMADPLDSDAIEEVEQLTGCKVQSFVGVLSDIGKTIERYYNTKLSDRALKNTKAAPLVLSAKNYDGEEHRKSVRVKAKISVHFPVQDEYRNAHTKDISTDGILFESPNTLPVGSYVVMHIELPREHTIHPIAAVVQVVRVVLLPNKLFDIGTRIVKIANDDMDKIMQYAAGFRQ
jgi:type IV pilus assembly protein PilB